MLHSGEFPEDPLPCSTTGSKEATRNKCHASGNKCLTSSNKDVTSNKKLRAMFVVQGLLQTAPLGAGCFHRRKVKEPNVFAPIRSTKKAGRSEPT